MYRISCVLVCSFFVLMTYAQDYSTKMGPTYKKEGGFFTSLSFLGLHGGHYFLLQTTKKGEQSILQYDMNHSLVSEIDPDLSFGKEKLYVSEIVETQNGAFALLGSSIDKNGKMNLYSSKFSNAGFGEVRELVSQDFKKPKTVYAYGIGFAMGDLNSLVVSEDDSKVARCNQFAVMDDDEEESMMISVFDADMNVLWSKNQSFKYSDKEMDLTKSLVTDDGVVYMLGSLSEVVVNPSAKKTDRIYRVFKITQDEIQEIAIDLEGDSKASDVAMHPSKKDGTKIILTGNYTSEEKKEVLGGVFSAILNSENGGLKAIKFPFDSEYLIKNPELEAALEYEDPSTTVFIHDRFELADGSYGFVAEKSHEISVNKTNPSTGGNESQIYYEQGDFIISYFSSEGELMSTSVLSRGFRSGTIGKTHYFGLSEDKIYLMFNDAKSKDEREGKKKWRYTDLVVFDPSQGSVEYNNTVFNSEEIDLEFAPYMTDINADRILFSTFGMKEYCFGTIVLK